MCTYLYTVGMASCTDWNDNFINRQHARATIAMQTAIVNSCAGTNVLQTPVIHLLCNNEGLFARPVGKSGDET